MTEQIFQAGFLIKVLSIALIAFGMVTIRENIILGIVSLILGAVVFWIYDWVHLSDLQQQLNLQGKVFSPE